MALSQSMGQSLQLCWVGVLREMPVFVAALTAVIEPLVQLPMSCPCSWEGCARRSGASRAVTLSLCLGKLCLEHVSSVDVLERGQWRARNALGELEHLSLWGEAESWDCSAWRGGGSGGSYQYLWILEGRMRRWQSQTLLSGAQWQDKRQWAQTEAQEGLWTAGNTWCCSFTVRVLSTSTGCIERLWAVLP